MTKTLTAVTTSITVDAPIEVAFDVFTEDMESWWPPDHHILQAPLASMVFEPRVGGRVYDVGEDGTECQWARVLVHEPPQSRGLQLGHQPAVADRVEPRSDERGRGPLHSEGPSRTRVELEHRNLDRHGEGWEGMRDAVGSPEGWGTGLQRFARHVEHVGTRDR